MPGHVLIVEDDPDIAESLTYNLRREGLETHLAASGEQGLVEALRQDAPPALIILDIMLPGMSGLDLCRRLRREAATRRTPIVMLTAKAAEADRVAGLDMGADDYVTKPFSVRELLARVRAVLRRVHEKGAAGYEDGRLSIDFADFRVSGAGAAVKLTHKEFGLLSVLSRNVGRVVTSQRLLDDVWGSEYYGDLCTLDVHIRRLRQKLEACGDCIETVGDVGYRFNGCGGRVPAGANEAGR